jgi:hypothetical protein
VHFLSIPRRSLFNTSNSGTCSESLATGVDTSNTYDHMTFVGVQRTSWTMCIFHLAMTQANTVVDSVQVSGGAMRQIMGHVQHSKTYHQHYQSDISTVNIKGLVLRDACDTGFSTDVLRCNRRVRRLPARLPSRAHEEYLRNWKETTWANRTISQDVHGKRA